jgi:hypothetical protein
MVLSGEVPGEVTDEPAPLLPPGVGADDPGHHLVVVHGEATYSAAFILLLPVCVLQLLLIHLDRYSCAVRDLDPDAGWKVGRVHFWTPLVAVRTLAGVTELLPPLTDITDFWAESTMNLV